MMKMKIYYILLGCLLFVLGVEAQNNTLNTMFVWNKLNYNPAFAGGMESLTINAHYRHQWEGFEGAPRTATISADLPFANRRCGIGLLVSSDNIGLMQTSYVNIPYSYRVHLKNEHVISAGINFQYDFTRFDWSNAQTLDVADDVIDFANNSNQAFNLGFGVYYSANWFYAGVSIPQLVQNSLFKDPLLVPSSFSEYRTMYGMAGFLLPIKDGLMIRPSILASYNPNTPFDLDLNLSVILFERFWVGASYRWEDSIDALFQMQLTQNLTIGLAADYTVSEITSFNKGSYEIMMRYNLGEKLGEKLRNLRFF